jgi:hypothetical protein
MDYDCKKGSHRNSGEKPTRIKHKEIGKRVRWDLNPRPQPVSMFSIFQFHQLCMERSLFKSHPVHAGGRRSKGYHCYCFILLTLAHWGWVVWFPVVGAARAPVSNGSVPPFHSHVLTMPPSGENSP